MNHQSQLRHWDVLIQYPSRKPYCWSELHHRTPSLALQCPLPPVKLLRSADEHATLTSEIRAEIIQRLFYALKPHNRKFKFIKCWHMIVYSLEVFQVDYLNSRRSSWIVFLLFLLVHRKVNFLINRQLNPYPAICTRSYLLNGYYKWILRQVRRKEVKVFEVCSPRQEHPSNLAPAKGGEQATLWSNGSM